MNIISCPEYTGRASLDTRLRRHCVRSRTMKCPQSEQQHKARSLGVHALCIIRVRLSWGTDDKGFSRSFGTFGVLLIWCSFQAIRWELLSVHMAMRMSASLGRDEIQGETLSSNAKHRACIQPQGFTSDAKPHKPAGLNRSCVAYGRHSCSSKLRCINFFS